MPKQNSVIFGVVLISMVAFSCGTNLFPSGDSLGEAKLGIILNLDDNSEILSVRWTITHPTGYSRAGDIALADPAATVSTYVSGIPAGTDYTVTLTASTATHVDCEGVARFDIVAGEETLVNMTLQCVQMNGDGTVVVNSDANMCPFIDYLNIQPIVQGVGRKITVYAEVFDIDPEDNLTYAWTASPADTAFDDPTSPLTAFNCDLGGTYTLTLAVTDRDFSTPHSCVVSKSVAVECIFDGICDEGFTSDGRHCVDIDECAAGSDNCSQNCDNTPGSFTCSCNSGYLLNTDGHSCDDIDECMTGNGNCGQSCTNTPGGFFCSCDSGYVLDDADGRTCNDVNECISGFDDCDPAHGTCTNTVGGYTCGCLPGWMLSPDSTACLPIFTATELAAGQYHTCGIKPDGTVACWGYNYHGQSSPPSGTFAQITAGSSHTCGLKSDGSAVCWGLNDQGQSSAPTGTFTEISTGYSHTCGLKTDGTVTCWGSNYYGQSVPPAGASFVRITAGFYHTCGVKTDGSVACWGYDAYGQSSPPPGAFTELAAGVAHTCGLQADGTVICWGRDNYGQSTSTAGSYVQISAGGYHTCGVKTDDTVACWGLNDYGQASMPTGTFDVITGGYSHTCGVMISGWVVCWGDDSYGACTPPVG